MGGCTIFAHNDDGHLAMLASLAKDDFKRYNNKPNIKSVVNFLKITLGYLRITVLQMHTQMSMAHQKCRFLGPLYGFSIVAIII